jgi:hypothetical protein
VKPTNQSQLLLGTILCCRQEFVVVDRIMLSEQLLVTFNSIRGIQEWQRRLADGNKMPCVSFEETGERNKMMISKHSSLSTINHHDIGC